jgi:hypothetical protein
MTDETFRQKKIGSEDVESEPKKAPPEPQKPKGNPMDEIKKVQESLAMGESVPQMTGTPPPALLAAAHRQKAQQGQQPAQPQPGQPAQPTQSQLRVTGSPELEKLISQIQSNQVYEEITLPSKGKFYGDLLPEGKIHIRAMTGGEEQILATSRYVKNGQAVNMIFQRCMEEQFRPDALLTADRTYLLIYLRGISYSTEYEVEVKCSECGASFNTVIDLDGVYLTYCPDEFSVENLLGVLPTTGFRFSYRLSTGKDELDLQNYRERKVKETGDIDDTLIYRSAQLLTSVEGVTDKNDLLTLIKKLPIMDVTHLRNAVGEPPFGVDTEIGLSCPMCLADFSVDLPMEANFFFPRRRKVEKTQA